MLKVVVILRIKDSSAEALVMLLSWYFFVFFYSFFTATTLPLSLQFFEISLDTVQVSKTGS